MKFANVLSKWIVPMLNRSPLIMSWFFYDLYSRQGIIDFWYINDSANPKRQTLLAPHFSNGFTVTHIVNGALVSSLCNYVGSDRRGWKYQIYLGLQWKSLLRGRWKCGIFSENCRKYLARKSHDLSLFMAIKSNGILQQNFVANSRA